MSLFSTPTYTTDRCEICDFDFITNNNSLAHIGGANVHFFHPDCIMEHITFLPDPYCPVCNLTITHINGLPLIRTDEAVENAIDRVVEGEDEIDTLHQFLMHGEISIHARGEGVISAAEDDYADIVEALLKTGDIEIEDRDIALLTAADNDNQEIFELLMPEISISELLRGELVISAARNANLEMIELIFKNGLVSRKDIDEAINETSDDEITAVLVRYSLISAPLR